GLGDQILVGIDRVEEVVDILDLERADIGDRRGHVYVPFAHADHHAQEGGRDGRIQQALLGVAPDRRRNRVAEMAELVLREALVRDGDLGILRRGARRVGPDRDGVVAERGIAPAHGLRARAHLEILGGGADGKRGQHGAHNQGSLHGPSITRMLFGFFRLPSIVSVIPFFNGGSVTRWLPSWGWASPKPPSRISSSRTKRGVTRSSGASASTSGPRTSA